MFVSRGKKVSYNYINRVLNDLSSAGYIIKRRPKTARGGRSRMAFYITKRSALREVRDWLDFKETENEKKDELEKARMMMDNKTISMFC